MQELEFLRSLVIIFGLSAAAVFVLDKLRVPSVVGFLTAGVFMGPHGLGLVRDTRMIETFAEIGVVLLLFVIGLEISLRNIKAYRRAILAGGTLQVAITTAAVSALSYLAWGNAGAAVVHGFLVSMSSTAVVTKLLFDRAELDSPHGRAGMGMLIFQDFCVVVFMLLIPLLAGGGDAIGVFLALAKSLAVIAAIIAAARWAVPAALHQVVRTRKHELFVISIVFVCLGSAFLTYKLGLSLALGAFVAGLVISESEYAHQTISDMLPLKDSFNGLFFISVGMLMDLDFFLANADIVMMAVLGIVLVKALSAALAGLLAGHNLRVSLHTGLVLSQIGEFSFVLAVAALAAGILTPDSYQIFLSSAVITILLTPLFVILSPRVSVWAASRRIAARLRRLKEAPSAKAPACALSGHVLIVGFGMNGRNLARVLKEIEVPYAVLELNSDTVRRMSAEGETIYYGDATSPEILHKAGIGRAKALVVAIADPAATRRIAGNARKLNPDIYIVVRTRYAAEVGELLSLGADQVIPEEFETSIELFSRVLQYYRMPGSLIAEYAKKIREDHYRIFTSPEAPKKMFRDIIAPMPNVFDETFAVEEGSRAAGSSLRELEIRSRTGAMVVSVRRRETIVFPEPDFAFEAGDSVLAIGERPALEKAAALFRRPG
jgi:CPA2 family monovalent cation:H+ antiporter-2